MPMTDDEWDRQMRAAAFHEAAHAVIAARFGMMVRERGITIRDMFGEAHIHHSILRAMQPGDISAGDLRHWRFEAFSHATVHLAGPRTESILYEFPARDYNDDAVEAALEEIEEWREEDFAWPLGDDPSTVACLRHFFAKPDLPEALRSIGNLAAQFLGEADTWHKVETVANRLLETGHVSSEEFDALVGGPPQIDMRRLLELSESFFEGDGVVEGEAAPPPTP